MWQRAVTAGATLPAAGGQTTAGGLKLLAFEFVAPLGDSVLMDQLRVSLLQMS
jgi:hypothetical protein